MTRNPIAAEPVLVQLVAGALAWAAAKYLPGVHLSDDQAFGIAAGIVVVLAPFVRQLVTPTAKLPTEPPPPAVPEQPPGVGAFMPPSAVAKDRKP